MARRIDAMKELVPEDRPREKLLRHGAAALGDNELVALVLGNGRRRTGALGVANELLQERGGLHGLARSRCDDLTPMPGIGPAKAAQLLAALELGRRTLTPSPDERPQFLKPEDAAMYLLAAFGARPTEHFGVVLLDTKHRLIKTTVVAVGALNATAVEPREVFREAIAGGAAGVVVFHNHPSGDPYPSPEDVALTRRLLAAARVVGIELMDHIVLGDARYCSLKEMGRI